MIKENKINELGIVREKTLKSIKRIRHEVSARNISVETALVKLQEELSSDKDFHDTYKANISMSIYDTFTSDPTDCFRGSGIDIQEYDLSELCNLAAEEFLDRFINR